MNASELKQKLNGLDNNKDFYKTIIISLLITTIFFPLNLWLNPDVDPIIYEEPILLGFGFLAITLTFLVFFVGAIVFTIFLLDGYLFLNPKFLDSIGKFNSSTIWRDDSFLDKMSYGIHTRVLKQSKKYTDPKIEELEHTNLRQQKEIDELKNNQINEKDYNRIISEQRQEIFSLNRERKQDKELIKKLLSEQSKTETNEKNSETISKENQFD